MGWCAKQLQPRAGPRADGESLLQVASKGRLLLGPIFCLAMRLLGVPWHCLIEPKSKTPRRRWGSRPAAAGKSLPVPLCCLAIGHRVRRPRGG